MTAQTLTLSDFLLARLAEDEVWAAANRTFENAPEWVPPWWTRVDAECEAKRKIMALHSPFECCNARCPVGLHCRTCEEGVAAGDDPVHYPCQTIRALTAAYAGHPGYDTAWRP